MVAHEPSAESIEQELERILGSRAFDGAGRASRFLRFVVLETLRSPNVCLKEYLIGMAVLDRGESFDPRSDSIVRVEAGRLRSRLRQYYKDEGQENPIRIVLPKGQYVPIFEASPANHTVTPLERPDIAKTVATAISSWVGKRLTRRFLVLTGLLVFTLAGIAIWKRSGPRSEHVHALAVLPLVNFSGDPAQDYLADGMTDLLITHLGDMPGLRVVSRSSVMRYQRSTRSVAEIARELNVDAVLEGGVTRLGNKVRLTAKLIHAKSEQQLWGDAYVRDANDILALQEELCRAVADRIQLRLLPAPSAGSRSRRRIHPDGLDAYLKARYLANQRTADSLSQSVEYYKLAISKDPGFAPAHSGLADAYVLLITYLVVSPREYYPKVRESALRAIQIDDSLAEAHGLMGGFLLFYDADWAAAEREYRRAIQLDPQFAAAHQRYALNLMWMGRFDQALAEIRTAQELDPLSPVFQINEGEIYFNSRQFAKAIEQCLKVIEQEPAHFNAYRLLGEAYTATGAYDKAIHALRTAVSSGGDAVAKGKLGYAYAMSGERDRALGIIDELRQSKNAAIFSFDIGAIYLALGDKDRAFQWLRRACDERTRSRIFLKVAPVLDALRSDRRYEELLNRVAITSGVNGV